MKKITLISLISALSCSALVHAGGMGEQTCGTGSTCNAGFVSLEGGYSVSSIGNYNFTITGVPSSFSSVKKTQHYAGRLAAGMITMMDEQWGMTGELGWGYYGRTTLNPNLVLAGFDFTMKHTITGFDALIGLAFVQPSYSISLKAGAMIQNLQVQTTSNFSAFDLPLFEDNKTNQTAALPEIKLGAAYNFDNNWSLTAAYLVAFGSSPKTTGNYDGIDRLTFNSNNLNPTINALLLGIQYTA